LTPACPARRFFSSLLQRAAKLAPRLGGGSLSLLPVLAGTPARGEAPLAAAGAAGVVPERYQHLSAAQQRKLAAALAAAQQDERLKASSAEACVRTEARSWLLLHYACAAREWA
jgi:hypothetical protein